MKRGILILFLLCSLPALSGCAGIYANDREVEQLLVIQTLGLDYSGERVLLSLASGAGVKAAGSPSRLQGSAPSITTAMESIRNRSNEEELFCSHISHVLVGEDAARHGMEELLRFICRSPELRISVPLYVARGGTAGQAVLSVGDDSYGICDALDAVNGDVKLRGDGHIFTAADVVRDLERHGSALVCAVECVPSAEKPQPGSDGGSPDGADRAPSAETESGSDGGEQVMTMAAAGYAVLQDGRLCAFIDREEAVGVGFLIGEVGVCELMLPGAEGEPVTLTIDRGGMRLEPVWDEAGRLAALELSVSAGAALSEAVSAEDPDRLAASLEAALAERIGAVLQLSKRLGADFLGLGSRVELSDPLRFRALDKPFSELLRELPIRLAVSARLEHTNDLQEEAP